MAMSCMSLLLFGINMLLYGPNPKSEIRRFLKCPMAPKNLDSQHIALSNQHLRTADLALDQTIGS